MLGLIYFGCCYHENGNLNVDNLDNWPETIVNFLFSLEYFEESLGRT